MNTKSRKSIKPTKTAPASTDSTQSTKPATPDSVPDTEQNNLVRIHDLISAVVIGIPQELRGLIGDEAYKRFIVDLEFHELTVILRETNDVVYIRMPVRTLPSGPSNPASQEEVKSSAGTGAKMRAKVKAKAKGKEAANPSSASSPKPRGSL